MSIEIIVPRLGWSMEEGTFSAWLKQDGDPVKPGDPLFVLESDKASQEVESIDAGILRLPPDAPRPGSSVKVGQRLAYLLAAGEAAPWETDRDRAPAHASSSGVQPSSKPALSEPPPPVAPPPSGSAAEAQAHDSSDAHAALAGPPAISPRAARTARELGVDWTRVAGSGRTGRIRERDIRAAAASRSTAPSAAPSPVMSPGNNPGSSTALSPTRRTIAERMTTSLRHTAPVTLATTEDVTRLVQLREQWKAAASTTSSVVPSYTDVLVKLCAAALSRHPALAARWEGERLLHARAIHIGLAVDTEAGLLVPVIHNVGELGLRDIAVRSRDLIERARARKLTAQELRGGVFTVTSLGSFGIEAFTPIINYPECAILGVGQVRREPWAVDNQIVLRDRVTLSLTFDHRAMDGATAARFLQTLCELVRSPTPHLSLEP